jgi:hypothetical protein
VVEAPAEGFEAPVDALSTQLQVDPLEVRPPDAETPNLPEDSTEVTPPPTGEAETTESQALDASSPIDELGSLAEGSETPSLTELPSLEDSSEGDVLPDSLEQVNPSDVVQPSEVPSDLSPENGEVISPEDASPPQVGTTPQDGPLDVVMPESLSPDLPTVGTTVNPIEAIVPPVGFEPADATAVTVAIYAVEDEPYYTRQERDNDSASQSDWREAERNTGNPRPWWESRSISQLESELSKTSPSTANTRPMADYLSTSFADNPSLKARGTQFLQVNSNVYTPGVFDFFRLPGGRGGSGFSSTTARPAATTAPVTTTTPTIAPAINGRPNVVAVPNPIPSTLGGPAMATAGTLAMMMSSSDNPSGNGGQGGNNNGGNGSPKSPCPEGWDCSEAAQNDAQTLMDEHPSLTQENALRAVQSPEGSVRTVKGRGVEGADVVFGNSEGTVLAREVKVFSGNEATFNRRLQEGARQVRSDGEILMQMRNGTNANDFVNGWRQNRIAENRGFENYQNVRLVAVDGAGNILFQGPLAPPR